MSDPELASGDIIRLISKKTSFKLINEVSKIGIDILSRALGQVPSAQAGLTSLFGMGRGDPRRNRHHKGIKFRNLKRK
jgi:hypothetical protein